MKTPLTSQLLCRIAEDLGWTHHQIATQTGIVQSTVTRHLSADRDVRDEHLSAYMSAVPSVDKPRLLAAWLRDVLAPADSEYLLDSGSGRLNREVADWLPELPPDQRHRLQWLAGEMLRDTELQGTITRLIGHLGYKPEASE